MPEQPELPHRQPIRWIILLWASWLIILWIYQATVTARYQVLKPDAVLFWTADSTQPQLQRPYLSQSNLPAQVGWDSEFYLSIALQGYDDPQIRTVVPPPNSHFQQPLSLNYAFLPVYPMLVRGLTVPLSLLGLNPVTTATLAGLLISALGTLAGMLALYTWITAEQDSATGLRAVFYLISFPTSFFLAQVYTEGLFIGLSFWCLVLVQRQRWIAASSLATLATLTRAVGIGLLIPLIWGGWQQYHHSLRPSRNSMLIQFAAFGLPLLTYGLWKISPWGQAFSIVQSGFFRCSPFHFSAAFSIWQTAMLSLFGNNPATRVHYGIEFSVILLTLLSCLLTLRKYPAISLYGLFILLVSLTCGTAWSISRYVLVIPSLFILLAGWGQSDLFDRVWSFLSLLLLALLTALFSFDLWAG
jgi:hypothetical protein